MFLLLVQLLMPLIFLAALAMRTRARTLKVCQALAIFFYILAVHLAGLWLDLPWWTPWVFWSFYVISLSAGWQTRVTLKTTGAGRWLFPIAWGVASATFAWLSITAVLARVPPAGPIMNVASPLPPGHYLVVNGGNRDLTNAHFGTLRPRTARQAAYRGQSYGIDIVGLNKLGRTSRGWQPRSPEYYAIFGVPVLAPCAGIVIARLDGRPDMSVPDADERVMAGNHVALRCGDVQLLLGHMKRGSVAVRQGQRVSIGDPLGQVGNSGNTGAPHLHIHAQRPGKTGALFAADPLPLRINGRYLVRGDRL